MSIWQKKKKLEITFFRKNEKKNLKYNILPLPDSALCYILLSVFNKFDMILSGRKQSLFLI